MSGGATARRLAVWGAVIASSIAALASVIAAAISWSSARSATNKDYVALAMSILSQKESSPPSRRWAVEIVSKLSPVSVPQELAAGLVTGRSVLPSELDPDATRAAILACMKPLLSSDLASTVSSAPLPAEGTVASWVSFADAQTGRLDVANLRLRTFQSVADTCIRKPMGLPGSVRSDGGARVFSPR